MTTPAQPDSSDPQAATMTASLAAAVLEGLEEGRQHSMELSGGWVTGWKILAGLAALPALLTRLQEAERENALLARDFGELRTAYALQAEKLAELAEGGKAENKDTPAPH